MEVYTALAEQIKKGRTIDVDNFPDKIWRFDKLKEELLDKISGFNSSSQQEVTLELHDVLTNKKDGTEHVETFELTRSTIFLVPGMYLRELLFDFSVFLEVTPKYQLKENLYAVQQVEGQEIRNLQE